MLYIDITNPKNGISVSFSYTGIFLINKYDDTASANNWVNTGYGQHGVSYIQTTMNSRTINFSFMVANPDTYDLYTNMSALTWLFNPTDGLKTITVTNTWHKRVIQAYVSSPLTITDRQGGLYFYSVQLTAPYPFYTDEETQSHVFTSAIGGFTFPVQFDTGKTFGLDAHTASILNAGDIPAPVKIILSGSAMVNPKVTLADGSFIGLTKSISAGEVVTITTEYGNKNITVNGVDQNRYLTTGSSWIQLPVGQSVVSVSCDSGDPNIKLYWNNYYQGM